MATLAGRNYASKVVLFSLGLIVASCAVKVAPSDLTGQWQMTEDAVGRLGLKVRPSFTLKSDGSLIADNLPASAFHDTGSWKRLYNGAGVWTVPPVRRTQGFSIVVLDFKKSGPDEPTGLTLQVDKDTDGFYVFAWLGEEGGDRLIFRR